jgi:hypothetical protein
MKLSLGCFFKFSEKVNPETLNVRRALGKTGLDYLSDKRQNERSFGHAFDPPLGASDTNTVGVDNVGILKSRRDSQPDRSERHPAGAANAFPPPESTVVK